MVYQDDIHFETTGHGDMRDLTPQVQHIVDDSSIRFGIVQVFNVGSTGVISAIEFEPGLKQDLPAILDRLFPMTEDWEHHKTWNDRNGGSHLQATSLGMDFSCPLSDGRLVLGTWQQIIHLECDDKPRHRRVVVTVIGE